jgi:hypothetical protein
MDVPRGALLVAHAVVIETVEVIDEEGVVRIGGGDGILYRFAMSDRILIDEATPERQARLAAARAALGGPPGVFDLASSLGRWPTAQDYRDSR